MSLLKWASSLFNRAGREEKPHGHFPPYPIPAPYAHARAKETISTGIKDNCQACNGSRGGEPGNENIVNGKVLCDYCHAEVFLKAPPHIKRER